MPPNDIPLNGAPIAIGANAAKSRSKVCLSPKEYRLKSAQDGADKKNLPKFLIPTLNPYLCGSKIKPLFYGQYR